MMKERGDGSITTLRNGRKWVRGPTELDGSRKSMGTYATQEEAEQILGAALALRGQSEGIRSSYLFVNFGRTVLDVREEDGYRAVKEDRSRFEHHLADSPIALKDVRQIETPDVVELKRWLMKREASDKRGKRKIKSSHAKRIMSVAASVFHEAIQRGIRHTNPCSGIEITRRADEDEDDEWTFLNLEEQGRFLNCAQIPHEDRVIAACIMFSGVRHNEAACNYLPDVHLDRAEPYVFVRWGKRVGGIDMTPKSKKPRKAYLFGQGLDAWREWIEIRKTYLRKTKSRHEVREDERLIFPTRTGCRRGNHFFGNGWYDKSHPRATSRGWVDRLSHYFYLAGIEDRPALHLHALRHTCATSLLEGLWGPPQDIQVVCEQLGHSSTSVTERYVHPDGVRVRAAVRAFQGAGYVRVMQPTGGYIPSAAIINENNVVGQPGLEPETNGLRERRFPLHSRPLPLDVDGDPALESPDKRAIAESLLTLMQAGQTKAALALAVTLAEANVEGSSPMLSRKKGTR